jgi:hypothetical protein
MNMTWIRRGRDWVGAPPIPRLRSWLLAGLCLTCAGCTPANAPSLTTASATVNGRQAEYVVANGKLLLVVWFVTSPEGGGTAVGVSANAAKTEIKGNYEPTGGTRIDWTCTTSDLATGTVTINGADYQLADGGLFLITPGDPPKVVQLKRDLGKVEGSQQGLETLAREDPEVSTFVSGEPATP